MTKRFVNVVDSRNNFIPSNTVGTFGSAIGAIILNKDGKVLLTQRQDFNEVNPGTWEIVFGRLNQSEGFEEALHREVKEEVGLDIEPIQMIGLMHFLRVGIEYNGVIFLCNAHSDSVRIQDSEIKAFDWLDLDEAINRVESYVKPHLEYVKSLAV
jgi:8-oxo-dGTP pyrophosphatase MutT (NUDIX family)